MLYRAIIFVFVCALSLSGLTAPLWAQTTKAPQTTLHQPTLVPTETTNLDSDPQPKADTALPSPAPVAANSLYHAQWAQNSVRILQDNGIQLPAGIHYDVLINQQDFIGVLAKVSGVERRQLRQYRLLSNKAPEALITRGEAIHLLLASFGLMDSLPNFKHMPSKFSDLSPSHPAYASIVLAESVHLINGYPDHTIRPDERLSWGEALILMETVYSWRKALPTSAPEWVKNYEKKQNMWFQLTDGFRLLLTIAYLILTFYFLFRSWRKTRHQKQSPYRKFSLGLALVTTLLGAMWISELLFNYHLIPREIYASLAMLSIFAGLFLLKLSSDIDGDIHKPKPQTVIDSGFVESINHERGELFIRDKASNGHSLALVGPDSKILRKTGQRSVESAFLSDIQIGDQVSLRGQRLEHDALMDIERITLLESAQQQQEQQSYQVQDYVQNPQQEKQQQFNHIHQRPPQT